MFLRLDGRPDRARDVPFHPAGGVRPLQERRGELTVPVVHVMTGLPASGKTTAARKLQAESEGRMRRVNLDDLRAMLDVPAPERGRSSYAHEQTVLAIQDAAVRAAVDDGFDVVVDNTHMTPHIPKRLKAAVAGQATFVVHDFTDVPVEECLRRDAERERPVGEEIIRILADKHAKARKGGWRLTAEWLNDAAPRRAVRRRPGAPVGGHVRHRRHPRPQGRPGRLRLHALRGGPAQRVGARGAARLPARRRRCRRPALGPRRGAPRTDGGVAARARGPVRRAVDARRRRPAAATTW